MVSKLFPPVDMRNTFHRFLEHLIWWISVELWWFCITVMTFM